MLKCASPFFTCIRVLHGNAAILHANVARNRTNKGYTLQCTWCVLKSSEVRNSPHTHIPPIGCVYYHCTHFRSADWLHLLSLHYFCSKALVKKCTPLTSVCTPGTHYQKAKRCLLLILAWATLLRKCMYLRGHSYHRGTSDTSVARAILIVINNSRCYMVQTNLHRVWQRCQPNRNLGISIIPRSCSP